MPSVARLAAAIVTALLLACPGAAQKPKEPPPDYFPLPVGATWSFKSTTATGAQSEFTLKVLSLDKQDDGSSLYLVETQSAFPIHDWYSKPSGSVLMHRIAYPKNNMSAAYQPVKQYLKNPLSAGASWSWKGKGMGGIDIEESSSVSGPEKVVVPAGTFSAMKVLTKVVQGGAPVTKTYWFANHVGLVKSMTDTGSVQSTTELVKYSFPK